MPVYTYQCTNPDCEAKDEVVPRARPVDERNDPIDCEKCGEPMKRKPELNAKINWEYQCR